VNKENIQALFHRASEKLAKQKKHLSASADAYSEYQAYFTREQVQNITNRFTHKDKRVLDRLHKMMIALYHSKESSQAPDLLANKLFITITEELFSKHDWLSLYIPRDFHKRLDYLILHDSNNFSDYYLRKFTCLFKLYCQLNPDFQDETLVKIHLYILRHPEEDLKLTYIASKFYLNHTYLSNLFSKKSSIHYSQFVTLVKLKRAEYLLNYTTLPVIDIAYQLGYKDLHYFIRIYKKTIGKSPAEYNREDYYYPDYSI
jgi:two-component system response regulator YesN